MKESKMPKKLKVNGPETLEDITAVRKKSPNSLDHERLLAVQMAQQGHWRIADIALALGRGHATIERWIRAYRQGGIPALLFHRQKTRDPQLTAEDIEALKQGLESGKFKRAKEVKHWLEKERGIPMTIWGVYYWLQKVNARPKVPRQKHAKQNEAEKEAFKQDITNRLEALEIPQETPVRIWVEDEHRYGLISNIRRCWALRGHRVVVPYRAKYQWGYIYGATDLVTGEAEFLFLPTVSLECSQLFLQHLVATDPQAIHVVVWDRAGFHPKVNQHDLPQQVRIIEFPAYCPELNPIETLWDMVKDAVSNTVWETLTAIEAAIAEELRPFWESAARVRHLLGDNWLTHGVASFLKARETLI